MKNKYEIRGDVTVIFIDSPKYGEFEALISTSKLDRAKSYPNKWGISRDHNRDVFYVGGVFTENKKQKNTHLQRWIIDVPKDMVVDHINHNTLDNTDSNLRIITRGENIQNRKGSNINSKTGIRGVTWHKPSNKWISQLAMNKKCIYVGLFESIHDAEKAVIEARKKYMPYSKEA